MFDGTDDERALKLPKFRTLFNLRSCGMAGDLRIPSNSSSIAFVMGEVISSLSLSAAKMDKYGDQ